jgi:hypothetical protein
VNLERGAEGSAGAEDQRSRPDGVRPRWAESKRSNASQGSWRCQGGGSCSPIVGDGTAQAVRRNPPDGPGSPGVLPAVGRTTRPKINAAVRHVGHCGAVQSAPDVVTIKDVSDWTCEHALTPCGSLMPLVVQSASMGDEGVTRRTSDNHHLEGRDYLFPYRRCQCRDRIFF